MRKYTKMAKLIITFVILFQGLPAFAEDQALAKLFAEQGVEGTIVISSLNTGKTFVHNDSRANQRYSTASTFKILNTLIALEEKIISGKDDVFEWDGQIYSIPNWNRDQTLESAFKVSCVWCYQVLARRVGPLKYISYIKNSHYGELTKPFEETTFWLDGSLQISAVEQVTFLKKVYQRSLPFNSASYETLRQIMLSEKTSAYSLWSKSGWATKVKPQVGWYVGYIETPRDVWFFALNIETKNIKDLPLRQKLSYEALKAKGIIE